MVSREASKCMLTNSESDSETAPSLGLEGKYSLDPGRQQVRKRNKALQVRFKDICDAQNEQAGGKGGKPVSYKVAYRKYMTVPARRSIPNVTKSTGVQTSPDLKKRYQTFPFERKKGHGHSMKHAAGSEAFKSHNNGLAAEPKGAKSAESAAGPSQCRGKASVKTRALLHTNECIATVEHHAGGNCADALLLGFPDEAQCPPPDVPRAPDPGPAPEATPGSVSRPREAAPAPERSAKRQLLNFEESSAGTLRDTGSKVTGPIAWNSLTQVECLESPSARGKRKKGLQLNGLQQAQSQTLPRAGCPAQARCHARPARPAGGVPDCAGGGPATAVAAEACQQIVPVTQDGELKAQLQVMENLISSSQETIKVLLGVIQELEKGEAHREGLSYRTGQDTANCDTCRNSACIIYSVELDFKQQEDKLQPLMKKLCPTEEPQFPPLPYPQEAFTSTPKRKSKTESKKHARWKLWFL
ncbi:inhibitory synaptic factor 2A [Anguilla anguilla]|uniref:inhibitory synaptic factor 2A n=1 Tax=Anguilla anguilla TaxID=7936 RepID=UPI0015AB0A78|nr:inhibitory synaptic factor 2A [Anguilla anguilla]